MVVASLWVLDFLGLDTCPLFTLRVALFFVLVSMILGFLIKQYLSGHQAEDKILERQGNGIKSDPKKRLYAVPCPRIFCELNFRKRLIGKKYVPEDIGLPCKSK
jgi:hypothetical protein